MIRIQKTKNILGILFFSLLSVSCQEWLDVSPSTEVKYDDLFSYKNGFKDQLTGVYTALCSEELYGAHLGFGMLDALGQQYYWNQEAGTYYYLHRFVYDNPKSEEVINSIWNNMYNAIANVNILLSKTTGEFLQPMKKKSTKGKLMHYVLFCISICSVCLAKVM